MILNHAAVFTGGRFQQLDIQVQEGRVASLSADLPMERDCTGLLLLPGLVDLHTHGCGGFDFDHAAGPQLRHMAETYLSRGVTTVLPTLMTGPAPEMLAAAVERVTPQRIFDAMKTVRLDTVYFLKGKEAAQ